MNFLSMAKHSEQRPEMPREILKFASLSKYPLRKRIMIHVTDFFLYWTLRLIGKTIRFEVGFEVEGWRKSNIKSYEAYNTAHKKQPASIIVFWHNRIFLTTVFWREYDITIMVSQSFDGEYISRIAQRFGYGVVRGSSTRGGLAGLKKMTTLLRRGISMSFTIDGPLGPRYKVKPGAITLAKHTGVPIEPVLIEPKKYWTINSWDKLQIPKPFTRAKVFIANPIFVSPEADHVELKAKCQEVQRKLDELVSYGKIWKIE